MELCFGVCLCLREREREEEKNNADGNSVIVFLSEDHTLNNII